MQNRKRKLDSLRAIFERSEGRKVHFLVDGKSETLNKSTVINKLWELKKSAKVFVDSSDIASAELGSPVELARVIKKYEIK